MRSMTRELMREADLRMQLQNKSVAYLVLNVYFFIIFIRTLDLISVRVVKWKEHMTFYNKLNRKIQDG